MRIAVTLVAANDHALSPELLGAIRAAIGECSGPHWLEPGLACDYYTEHEGPESADRLRRIIASVLAGQAIDWAVQPDERRRKRLLVSDMDSTIIGQECVDEIAERAGVGSEVAAITERAMAGELDFAAALAERVALLRGLDEAALSRVMAEDITLNPGAATLVATMRRHGAFTLLVSGGFTFCASEIAARAGFDDFAANRLIIEDGMVAGHVAEPILGREAKLSHLLAACERLEIEPQDVLGLGDGANDLALIENAGLGIAYRAKPILADQADGRIDHTDFTAALYFQGYRRGDFATP